MSSDGLAIETIASDYLGRVRNALDGMTGTTIVQLVGRLNAAYLEERRVFIIGNGGSASTASHMACDLAKNTLNPGPSATPTRFRVTSLVDNIASITAYGNDLGFDRIFSEQLKSLAEPGDVLVAISASGNSPNVIEATKVARQIGLETIGILGFGGGRMKDLVDLPVIVESHEYGPVEDVHMILNHLITTCIKAINTGTARLAPAALDSTTGRHFDSS